LAQVATALRLLCAIVWATLAGCVHAPTAGDSPGLTRIECHGEAGEVWAIGSFDGWQGRLPLRRDAEGRYVAQVPLPPGRSLVVCVRRTSGGARVTEPPLNAPATEDDGFGGRNGVYEIAPGGNLP
jgi:hypothetical protein